MSWASRKNGGNDMRPRRTFKRRTTLVLGATALIPAAAAAAGQTTILNVSYDPTRELYKAINAAFLRHQSRQNLAIRMSHGGSGQQAQAVIDGLDADVVTL